MAIKVGINGFGRIGRVVFRTCFQNKDIALTAINDPAIDIEYICYLIKFDSTHGKFRRNVTYTDSEIIIDDHRIKVFREKLPRNVPWHTAGVQYVVEASGMFTCLEKAEGHLASEGVKRVLLTAPSIDVPMVILGVNDTQIGAEHRVLSCASSTLYCLAPIIKVLNDEFGVAEGFMTSIHAMTPSLKPLDGLCLRGKHWRDNRSIHQNIIPARTGACNALGKIIPQLKDKIIGLAFRVPIVNVSVLDITLRLDKNTSISNIVKSIEKASKSNFHDIITLSNEAAVSSDFMGDNHSCVLDVDSTLQLKPNFFKFICWYENEYSYACRVIDSIFFSEMQYTSSMILMPTVASPRLKVTKKKCEEKQTKPIKNEISIKFDYTELPKILRTTSTETGLAQTSQSIRPLFLRKPLSSHNVEFAATPITRDTKKRTDTYKTCRGDTDMKSYLRQHKDSLFNSCIALSNTFGKKSTVLNAQARLATVKKEFYKMLNITEDLLNKSKSLRGTRNISKETLKECDSEIKGSTANIIGMKSNDDSTRYKESGDFVDDNDDNSKTPKESKVFHGEPEDTALKEKDTVSQVSLPENPPLTPDTPKPDSNIETTIKNIMVATIENSLSTYSSVFEIMAKDSIKPAENTLTESNKCILPDDTISNETIQKIEEKAYLSTQSLPKSLLLKDIPTYENKLIDFAKYLESNKENNIQIIDEALKKRNMMLVNLDSSLFENESVIQQVGASHRGSSSDDDTVACYNTTVSKLRDTSHENLSICQSAYYTETTISNGDTRKIDLYDKLESVSGSDSDNSFQIHEQKSQVIHITDLTNSLEDLSRLDKICRIIEISDELSDKLFSKLNNRENAQKVLNKWSFNDLCNRIQLDDFCNNLFGKTSA